MTSAALRPLTVRPRRLGELLPLLSGLRLAGPPVGDISVTGITHDSRTVRPGDLYAALPGSRVHGAAFAGQAAAAGAVAALTDPAGIPAARAIGLPVLAVPSPRAQLGAVASWVYGDPSGQLRLLGVTGTNGKTTVAYLLEAGLRAEAVPTGLLGTVETRVAGRKAPSARTTPEATDLQALLAAMVEQGVRAAAMEVSSHALALNRVDGTHFSGAAFTNLSQDHLDFHPTMEDYFAAKASLFSRARVAVIGVDDAWGRRLAARLPGAVTFAVGVAGAQWQASDIEVGPDGTAFHVRGPDGQNVSARSRLPGPFNVRNALAAITLLAVTGTPPSVAVEGIATLSGIPGRMERVEEGQPFLAFVDYAHTPEAVTNLLGTLCALVSGRVTIVVGCGGERDRGKRPLMGAAAARGADLAVLTNDNPRSEDPALILAAMTDGVSQVPPGQRGEVVVEPDRTAAVRLAVSRARPGDAVVVAGKGHETGQEQGGMITPFDDREVLRAALSAQGSPA